jgi:gliding motility-associated lipoprotein GldH
MKLNKSIILFIITTTCIFISCDRNRIYEEYVEIDDYIWSSSVPLRFEFEIEDPLPLHNIIINVRHATIYPYSNLWLFVTTIAPNGNIIKDTVECVLAAPNGRWKGSGLGDIWDYPEPWMQNIRFAMPGKHRIEIEHAMRDTLLPAIMDIGIRVEKVDEL